MDHSDMDVLEACSRLYYIVCNEELPIYNKVALARIELVDELVDKLTQLLGSFLNEVCMRSAAMRNQFSFLKQNLSGRVLAFWGRSKFEMQVFLQVKIKSREPACIVGLECWTRICDNQLHIPTLSWKSTE